jgi:NAD(P)-dependent dehydrogenase (short-subunit alcohol dehydrogenase family)
MKVLVTGAEGALGSAVTERFLRGGATVFATYFRDKPKDAASAIQWVQSNLSDANKVRATIQEIGAIDALVHCAGGFRWAHAGQVSAEDLDFLIDTNLRSAFHLVKEVLPGMKARGFGRIVFVSSKQTLQPSVGMAAYAASKAGINMLTLALAEEVKSFDINVNAVLPTIIDTPANRSAMPGADFKSWVPREQLAEIIFSLTQPQTQSVNGALIPVSGRV